MKAVLKGQVIAASDDTVEAAGYHYFPAAAVRVELLRKAPKTERDHACPHGVQFYDVVLDGTRHERAAWMYEAPREALAHTADRFGFWREVEIG